MEKQDVRIVLVRVWCGIRLREDGRRRPAILLFTRMLRIVRGITTAETGTERRNMFSCTRKKCKFVFGITFSILASAFLPIVAALLLLLTMNCFGGVADDIRGNTVIVTNGMGHGSGVMVSNSGRTFIWTAGHVAEIFENSDGTYREATILQGGKVARARVIRGGDFVHDRDFALLELIGDHGLSGDAHFYQAFDEIELGQRIVHCGSPFDKNWNERLVFFGRMSAVEQWCDPVFGLINTGRYLDHIDITGGGGCSGGPVVDEADGGIVGLLVMGMQNGHRVNIMEPTRYLYAWAKRHDCMWAVDFTLSVPAEITPWLSDSYLRRCRERDDSRHGDWGKAPVAVEPVEATEPKSLWEIIEAIVRSI